MAAPFRGALVPPSCAYSYVLAKAKIALHIDKATAHLRTHAGTDRCRRSQITESQLVTIDAPPKPTISPYKHYVLLCTGPRCGEEGAGQALYG